MAGLAGIEAAEETDVNRAPTGDVAIIAADLALFGEVTVVAGIGHISA